jgi:acyl-[acyl-carrier-protein]-phospholipid O-acyltransferase/long-chain-fatty-acid--[acyl-carrier-protein] ligase
MEPVTDPHGDPASRPASFARVGAFFYTQFCSALNDNLQQMAIALYLARSFGSAQGVAGRWQAIVGAAFVLPFILFSPLAGSLADRYEKRSVLIASKWLEVIPVIASFLSTYLPTPSRFYGLVLGVFLMETRAAFFSPAKYGLLPEVIPRAGLVRANGALQFLTMVAIVSGEALGGVAYKTLDLDSGNLRRTILICVGLSVIGSLLTFWIPHGAKGDASRPARLNPLGLILGTLKELRQNRALLVTLFTLSAFWMISAIFRMNIPLFGTYILQVGPDKTGYLWAFVSIGIGIGAALAALIKGSDESMGLVLPGVFGMAIASVATGLGARRFGSAACFLGILGVFGGLYLVPQTTLFQVKSPPERRGAYLAVQNFFNFVLMFLAAGVFWLLTGPARLDAGQIFLYVGVGIALLGAVQALALPGLLFGMTLRVLHRVIGVRT